MKIVIPALSLETGGGARFLYQLANALVDKGHNLEFVIPESGDLAWPVRAKITRVKELTPATIPSADFILPNFWPTVMPAWQSKKGQVVRLSLVYEPLFIANPELTIKTYQINVPIITISQWQRQIILSETGLDSTVINAGVDTSVFRPYPKLSDQTGRKNIFFIMRGPGYTWKGSADFLEACKQLKEEITDFDIFVVIPEGVPFESSVPYIVKSASTDFEMAKLYAQADLFIYTSYGEGFGMPPLEAMACGTAVVTTDCGGNRDYTITGENCLVVPPSDPIQLTNAMKRLLQDNEERQRLATAGPYFVKPWTWQRTADQVESILRNIAKG